MVFLKKTTDVESGFTLIEVMVAMMVMAICLTLIMESFSGGLRSKAWGWEYNTAVAQAENIMTDVLNSSSLETGADSGIFENGNQWEADIFQWTQEDPDQEPPLEIDRLFKIIVTIRWTSGNKEKTYRLETLAHG